MSWLRTVRGFLPYKERPFPKFAYEPGNPRASRTIEVTVADVLAAAANPDDGANLNSVLDGVFNEVAGDAGSVVTAILGYEYAATATNGDWLIRRRNPEPFTRGQGSYTGRATGLTQSAARNDNQILYAQSAELIDAYGNHTQNARGNIVFDNYVFAINYADLKYDLREDAEVRAGSTGGALLAPLSGGGTLIGPLMCELSRNVTTTAEYASEAIQAGPGIFAFVSSPPQPIPLPPPKLFPTMRLTYKWHRVPYNNNSPLQRLLRAGIIGYVNSTYFDFRVVLPRWMNGGALGFPPGTVLLTGVQQSDIYHNAVGYAVTDITYSTMYRNNGLVSGAAGVSGRFAGWNHLYRGGTNTFAKVTGGTPAQRGTESGRPLYPGLDFNQLFRLGNAATNPIAA